jgi:hypothetical protein
MNDHIKSEISSYLAGLLPESRNRQIESHAAACDKCRSALSKAKAKQARVKREALKKAEPEKMPNLFLARQGKSIGPGDASSGRSWAIAALVLLVGAGYWGYRRSGNSVHTPIDTQDIPATTPNPAPSPAPVTPVSPAPVTPPPPPPPAEPKPPLVLHVFQDWKGPDSGIKEGRLVVIRHEEAWQKLWSEMQMKDPLPEIDFDQKLVVGIFTGEQPAGTSITLGRMEEMDGVMYAPYRINLPNTVQVSSPAAPSAPVTPAHPYLLALVPRVDMKIRITEKENSQ